jgi:hypothetical protein
MKALDELLTAALASGLRLAPQPGLPAYLADAVHRAEARTASPSPQTPGNGQVVIAGQIEPAAPGDWLVADLPYGTAVLPVRSLAAELAQAGVQAYEVMRLAGGQAVLIGHGTSHAELSPAAAGSPVAGNEPCFVAGAAASDIETLAMINGAVLGAVGAAWTMAAMSRGYQTTIDEQADELRRAGRTEQALRREVGQAEDELSASRATMRRMATFRLYRLERRLRRFAGRVRRGIRRRLRRLKNK